jgi:hypothetical protein
MPDPPAAVRVWVYNVPIVAAGNGEAVVIVRVTGKAKMPAVELLLLSVTFTWKAEVTAVEGGIPESMPPGLMPSHVG